MPFIITCMQDELQYRDLFVSISPFLKKTSKQKKNWWKACCVALKIHNDLFHCMLNVSVDDGYSRSILFSLTLDFQDFVAPNFIWIFFLSVIFYLFNLNFREIHKKNYITLSILRSSCTNVWLFAVSISN